MADRRGRIPRLVNRPLPRPARPEYAAVDYTSIWADPWTLIPYEEEGSDPFWAAVGRLRWAAADDAIRGGRPHPALLSAEDGQRMRRRFLRLGLSLRAATAPLP